MPQPQVWGQGGGVYKEDSNLMSISLCRNLYLYSTTVVVSLQVLSSYLCVAQVILFALTHYCYLKIDLALPKQNHNKTSGCLLV